VAEMSDDADDALLDELAALLGPRQEPPPEVLHAAREAFAWRTVDAELAALTYDSLLDEAAVAVRAVATPRVVTFETPALTIEVEVDAAPSGRRLLGQLLPAQEAELELLEDGAVRSTGAADDLGRFVLALPAAVGRVALRCRLADGATVATAPTVL
jgi:hypothetical protein